MLWKGKINKTLTRRKQVRLSAWSVVSCTMTKKGLRIHSMVHAGERPFPCNTCEDFFCQKPTKDKHKKMHAKETSLCTLV